MASKRNGIAPEEWNKHMGSERGLKRKVERKVRAESKKIIRNEIFFKNNS
jgi:hypothetical protein|tara:strand:- start:554 stop:703 length:150 start_codon:yes stop_codon:yes gene_type:complete